MIGVWYNDGTVFVNDTVRRALPSEILTAKEGKNEKDLNGKIKS